MKSDRKVIIRPARKADLPAIVAMLVDDVLGSGREASGGDLSPYEMAFADIAAQPGNTVYVAEQGGSVVGCFQLTLIPNLSLEGARRALIEAVRVAGSARGQGLGERMMRFAVDEARRCGSRIVQLTSNRQRADAIRFYERLGFEPTHIGFKLYLED